MKKNNTLQMWKERLSRSETAYSNELLKMEQRDSIFSGTDLLRKIVDGDIKERTHHVRNIASELVEAQVSSTIPQPKVTPKRPEDYEKAKMIEDLLRNELDRMPFETINDLTERTVPVQGGSLFLIEWDNGKGTHTTAGELAVTFMHPKQVIPQEGVYTGIEDMDYVILKVPQTRESIRRKYQMDIGEKESEDLFFEVDEANPEGEDLVTQYIAYYKNELGGIGLYSWAADTELMNFEDYQARQRMVCGHCGKILGENENEKSVCTSCGGRKWIKDQDEYEEITLPLERVRRAFAETENEDIFSDMLLDRQEVSVWAPCYKPNMYPVILQKNVSVYGRFLGDSDIDKIADQQNTVNRIEQKIIDKLMKSGSYLVLPEQADIEANAEDMKIIRPESPAAAGQIGVKDLQGNIDQDMKYLEQVYQEARQITGITDSFQGRRDTTATSGRAKEFAASQAAGRLESKRVMKDAAYSALFEVMFKYVLAYMDEPRHISAKDSRGNPEFKVFNRYDFLEQDEAGEWYWNDQFLFSCDTTAPLASNREAMWEETRKNFQGGTFGDPMRTETLILFWKKMEMLHYPGAAETRATLEEQLQEQQMQEKIRGAMQGEIPSEMQMNAPQGVPAPIPQGTNGQLM
jgi:hypothetical protein